MDVLDDRLCASATNSGRYWHQRRAPVLPFGSVCPKQLLKLARPAARDPCRQPCFQKNACPCGFPNPDCRARGDAELISDHILLGCTNQSSVCRPVPSLRTRSCIAWVGEQGEQEKKMTWELTPTPLPSLISSPHRLFAGCLSRIRKCSLVARVSWRQCRRLVEFLPG